MTLDEYEFDTMLLSDIYLRGFLSMRERDNCPLTNPSHRVQHRHFDTPIYNEVAKEQGISPAETWAESTTRVQAERLRAMTNARIVFSTAMPLDVFKITGVIA